MRKGVLRSAAVLTLASLAGTGCEQLSPSENAGVFGGSAAIAAGSIARASGMNSAESFATGATVGAVVAATVYVITKHQASVRQREVAQARARAAYAKMLREQEDAPAPARKHATSNPPPKKQAKVRKKVPRYIAVDTVKDEHTSPRAEKSVMIWDTQSQEIVGNNVYDVGNAPAQGATAKFETYSAEYVGAGL